MLSAFEHTSVLLEESIEALNIQPSGIYIDGTAGGGGHSFKIASRLRGGRLIALDRDPEAIEAAGRRLAQFKCATLVQANFSQMKSVLSDLGIAAADGILLDLGASSHQFDTPERGFSYQSDALLDMRMSKQGMTAAELVNSAPFEELARIFREYGEERFAARIASLIVRQREQKPIETTFELSELIKRAIPAAARRQGPHPARRVFQALRIAVNGELDELGALLDDALGLLNEHGRLAVITFHSLEDRMVKQRFVQWARGCTCPPDFPVCVCGKTPQAAILYKRGIEAPEEEQQQNPRSRSARLRTVEKLAAPQPPDTRVG
ncbi:MAG: 16S rRNA (cytosine(1402)-N(4))-methyltransferase RsmH [Clostridia bacterium]|nr:16S rRNA (cytosine(1402)-N(4))-methyltransferase RsmH [Clostridia bacterium]